MTNTEQSIKAVMKKFDKRFLSYGLTLFQDMKIQVDAFLSQELKSIQDKTREETAREIIKIIDINTPKDKELSDVVNMLSDIPSDAVTGTLTGIRNIIENEYLTIQEAKEECDCICHKALHGHKYSCEHCIKENKHE